GGPPYPSMSVPPTSAFFCANPRLTAMKNSRMRRLIAKLYAADRLRFRFVAFERVVVIGVILARVVQFFGTLRNVAVGAAFLFLLGVVRFCRAGGNRQHQSAGQNRSGDGEFHKNTHGNFSLGEVAVDFMVEIPWLELQNQGSSKSGAKALPLRPVHGMR